MPPAWPQHIPPQHTCRQPGHAEVYNRKHQAATSHFTQLLATLAVVGTARSQCCHRQLAERLHRDATHHAGSTLAQHQFAVTAK